MTASTFEAEKKNINMLGRDTRDIRDIETFTAVVILGLIYM